MGKYHGIGKASQSPDTALFCLRPIDLIPECIGDAFRRDAIQGNGGSIGATWMHPLGVPDFLSWLCPKMAADYATGTDVRYRRGFDGIDPFLGWTDLLNSDRQARTVHPDSPFWDLLPGDGTRHDVVLREIFNANRTSLRAFRLSGIHGDGAWLYLDVSWRTRLQEFEIEAIEVHLDTAYRGALHEWKHVDTSRPVLEATVPKSSYLELLERRELCLTQADELLRQYLPEDRS